MTTETHECPRCKLESGEAHWFIVYLGRDDDGKSIYAVDAPSYSWDGGKLLENKEDRFSGNTRVYTGSMEGCLSFLKAITVDLDKEFSESDGQ